MDFILEIFLLLAVALFGALIAHAALSRLTKALLWAWSPLTRDEVEVHVYQRAVYRTADPTLRPVLGAVAAAGLPFPARPQLAPSAFMRHPLTDQLDQTRRHPRIARLTAAPKPLPRRSTPVL